MTARRSGVINQPQVIPVVDDLVDQALRVFEDFREDDTILEAGGEDVEIAFQLSSFNPSFFVPLSAFRVFVKPNTMFSFHMYLVCE